MCYVYASGNRKCSGVAQLPRIELCNSRLLNYQSLSFFIFGPKDLFFFYYSFQVSCMIIKDNTNKLSTFQTGKIHENIQYFLNKIRDQFQNFSPRRRGPGGGLGGLYSIECPRIGGKKTISLKRFFSPTRAPAGPPENLIYPFTFRARPVDKSVQGGKYDKKKKILQK